LKKFVLILQIIFICISTGCVPSKEPESLVVLKGKIVDVIEKRDSETVPDFYLKIEKIDSKKPELGEHYFLDDFFIVYLIENAHSLIFSDYLSKDIAEKNITVKLEEVLIEQKDVNGELKNMITAVEKFYPDYQKSEESYEYKEVNPGCPEPDFYHRYIKVPISYDHPEWGEFELYYELCGDFQEGKPTLMVPTDGQRTFPQVGWADRYKKIFNTSLNVVTYEYRGMYCSDIFGFQKKKKDWVRIYESLNSDNVIEDIENIRKDLLGDKKINILGGSGTAMMGLKYLSKYHQNVDRAYLMSFFKDAQGSSESGIKFFNEFLEKNNLEKAYSEIVQKQEVKIEQLLFLIQRLLYYDQDKAVQLIEKVSQNDLTLVDQLTDQLGTVDYFIRSAQKYKPWTVVFMYETNIKTSEKGTPDINYPFYKEAEPLNELAEQGLIPKKKFDIQNLENISTEVLLLAGTQDQVAPVEETIRIHKQLPHSKLAVFKAYHCLEGPPEAKKARNDLVDLFFLHGSASKELNDYLKNKAEQIRFQGLKPLPLR
jgi:pimeloyl-ACP methyl ester carboxylesterase